MQKMKITTEQKAQRKEWKKAIKDKGGVIFTTPDKRATILAYPSFPGSRFMVCTTAFCSPNDTPSRKYGEYVALSRIFETYQYVMLPIPTNVGEHFSFQEMIEGFFDVIIAATPYEV